MTITLTFDGFEERHEMLQAIHAVDYVVALVDVDDMLRRHWKYNETLTDEQRTLINGIWAEWNDIKASLPEEI